MHQRLGRRFFGYTPLELLKIETEFLKGCGYVLPLHHKNAKPEFPTSKETLFKGLCAAVNVLCSLDNEEDVMEYYLVFKKEEIFEILETVE